MAFSPQLGGLRRPRRTRVTVPAVGSQDREPLVRRSPATTDIVNMRRSARTGRRIDRIHRLQNAAGSSGRHGRRPVGEPLTGKAGVRHRVAFGPERKRWSAAAPTARCGSGRRDRLAVFRTPLTGTNGPITAVAIAHDGAMVGQFRQQQERPVRLWDLVDPDTNRPPLTGRTAERDEQRGVQPGRERLLASTSGDKSVRLGRRDPGTIDDPLTGTPRTSPTRGIQPEQRTLASSGWDKTVRLWRSAHPAARSAPRSPARPAVSSTSFRPRRFGARRRRLDGSVTRSRRCGRPVPGHTDAVSRRRVQPGRRPSARLRRPEHGLSGVPATGRSVPRRRAHRRDPRSRSPARPHSWRPGAGIERFACGTQRATRSSVPPLTRPPAAVRRVAISPDEPDRHHQHRHPVPLWDVAARTQVGAPLTGRANGHRCRIQPRRACSSRPPPTTSSVRLWTSRSASPLGQSRSTGRTSACATCVQPGRRHAPRAWATTSRTRLGRRPGHTRVAVLAGHTARSSRRPQPGRARTGVRAWTRHSACGTCRADQPRQRSPRAQTLAGVAFVPGGLVTGGVTAASCDGPPTWSRPRRTSAPGQGRPDRQSGAGSAVLAEQRPVP